MAMIPTIKQYTANHLSLLFLTNLIIQVQAAIPAIKAAIKPIPKVERFAVSVERSPLMMSLAIFPKINGTTIKNEKRAAFPLSFPNNTEVEIVAPLLEIPGSMAMA